MSKSNQKISYRYTRDELLQFNQQDLFSQICFLEDTPFCNLDEICEKLKNNEIKTLQIIGDNISNSSKIKLITALNQNISLTEPIKYSNPVVLGELEILVYDEYDNITNLDWMNNNF